MQATTVAAANDHEPVVEFDHVTKIYRMGEEKVTALDDVTFTVRKGEYVAITGTSGSGKSTALHLIGLLDRPTSGEIRVEGNDTAHLSDAAQARLRGQSIGFVFQYFHLYPTISSLANIELPMSVLGMPTKKRRERGLALLERVGLGDRAGHLPSELSGGQRQRVAIARAFSNDPAIILADEPTGNLDTKTGEEILEILQEGHQQGKTLIIVTHDMRLAERAERIIHLRDGRLVDA